MIGKSGKWFANPAVARQRGDEPEKSEMKGAEHKSAKEEKIRPEKLRHNDHMVEVHHNDDDDTYHTVEQKDGVKGEPEQHNDLQEVHDKLRAIFGDHAEDHNPHDEVAGNDENDGQDIPGLGQALNLA